MSRRVELVYSPELVEYDHGPDHPLRPMRVKLTRELIRAYGVVDDGRVREVPARVATDEELTLVHTERYLDAVRRAGELVAVRVRPWRQPDLPGDARGVGPGGRRFSGGGRRRAVGTS